MTNATPAMMAKIAHLQQACGMEVDVQADLNKVSAIKVIEMLTIQYEGHLEVLRGEQRAIQAGTDTPRLVAGKQTFSGTVENAHVAERGFGPTAKMTVVDEHGNKVSMSIPKVLLTAVGEKTPEKLNGRSVSVWVDVQASNGRFHFGKGPKQATLL